jgi:WD40 repeat protein
MRTKRDNKNFNPFPGLRPFTQDESDLFFGRGTQSEDLLEKLLKNRHVAVIGASGSGKSSLIYCGLLPKIRNLIIKESSPWRIISFRPGNDPYGNLAEALSENIQDSGKGKSEFNIFLSGLKDNIDCFADVAGKLKLLPEERVLIIIDQFDDLFRYNKLGKDDNALVSNSKFVDSIVKAVLQPPDNTYFVFTMRSDFIGACSHFQGLSQLINSSNYMVPRMIKENFREAIEGPIKLRGAKIETDLVETLILDIGDRSDQLPVLQHTMMRIWDQWQELDEPDRPINKNDYNTVGTYQNALSQHAEEAYEELNNRGKVICELMFKSITEKGSDNKGLRHPLHIRTIKYVAGCTSEELFDVVEKFRIPSRAFVTVLQNEVLNDDSVIDISHESIIPLWDRLRKWVDEEAASVQMYMRLSESSAMYQQGKTSLWRPPDLLLAINWRNQYKPTLNWAERFNPAFERAMVFLRTSEKEFLEEEENKIKLHKRRMKRTKIVAGILGVAAIISLGLMLLANVQKKTSDRQTILAEKQRIQAQKEKLLADSTAVIAIEQRTMAYSSANDANKKAEEAIKQKEKAYNQISMAEKIAAEAISQRNAAFEQSDSAKRVSIRAEREARIATDQKNVALSQRMISLGKSMSLKSLQLQGQKDLQTLLAYQAYLFNKNYNGPDNDADIFGGLYNVALQYGNPYCKSFKGHKGGIKSIAFAPAKNEFYTSGYDGQVLKWSLEGKEQTFQIIYSGSDIIEVLAVSPDASWLACGSENSKIRMIPLKANNVAYEMAGHKGKIKSLIFSFNGKYLYSASIDGKVLKWDIEARTNTSITDGSMQITSIDISSNGNYMAGINSEGKVMVWNPDSNSDKFRIETAGKNIKVIRFNPDNNLLALGDADGNVELWDVNLRKRISEVRAHNSQINDIKFNTTLKQMATAGDDKTLKLFNIKDPSDLTEPPVTFSDNEGLVLVMEFSSDGEMIVSGSFEGDRNIISRPTHVDYLARNICNTVSRNMTQNEWNTYVAKDIPLEKTCLDRSFKIKIDPIR